MLAANGANAANKTFLIDTEFGEASTSGVVQRPLAKGVFSAPGDAEKSPAPDPSTAERPNPPGGNNETMLSSAERGGQAATASSVMAEGFGALPRRQSDCSSAARRRRQSTHRAYRRIPTAAFSSGVASQ